MIPKKTYKIAMSFNKILVLYLIFGLLLLLLIMFILEGKVSNFEMICSIYSIIFFVGFMALGGIGLHFIHLCACPFCGAGKKYLARDDKYDSELIKAKKTENLFVHVVESTFLLSELG